ncbi:MAG TPA: hypothetical protein DCM40_07480, partial [Maribacter sp.]|nr:hypothetical protein [Maribacter sp.]
MNYIAITSDQPRHREFISRIEEHTSLSHVIVVSKPEGNKEFCKSEDRFFKRPRKSVEAEIIQCSSAQLGS